MQMAIEKADKYSVGVVVVKNSNHFGAAAAYTLQAVKKDMIGFATTNAPCRMVPTGGIEQIIGNNPFSYAIPSGDELPIVLDVSCSVVSLGKIILKIKKGENIPLGWALDKDGNATTDPCAAIEGGGSLVPIGEYKGYGMALVSEILSGILSDSIDGIDVQSLYNLNTDKKFGAGHFFLAIKIDNFIPINSFKYRIDKRIKEIKNSAKKEGVKRIYLPGEIEFRNKEKNLRDGIPIAKEVLEDLRKTAKELGINIDDYNIFK
jgi:LDH2 family malate/lactate/ureidoglycolate dehydrogenase